jgi:inner membrane protein
VNIIPGGKAHIGFGVLIGVLVILYLSIFLNPIFLILGSLFPDTDKKNTILGRIIPLWLIFKHRGFTHKIWGMGLFTWIVYHFFGDMNAFAFLIGYFTHLFLDSFTPRGVKWF